MQYYYNIEYTTLNTYKNPVNNALWQFLIEPKNNDSQFLESTEFLKQPEIEVSSSVNGYGFKTFKVMPKKAIDSIAFKANFSLIKNEVEINIEHANLYKNDLKELDSDLFNIEYHTFLKNTKVTSLPSNKNLFLFDESKTTFNNLKALNKWVYLFLYYTKGITDTNTLLQEVILHNKGVAKDFTHLFCAVARKHKIPTRFVSGYLNQGNNFFGNTQIHSWAECYIPNMGWVAFDPTNNMVVDYNYIKIAHGKDYQDCASLKGVIFSSDNNTNTEYKVKISVEEFKKEQLSTYQNISTYNLINNNKTI